MTDLKTISITLVATATGESDAVPIPPTATLKEVIDLCRALFGIEGDSNSIALFKDGKRISGPLTSTTLQSAQIQNGDVLAVQSVAAARPAAPPSTSAPAAGGLDFGNLLQGSSSGGAANSSGGGGGLDFSGLLQQQGPAAAAAAAASSSGKPPAPVYYPNMNLEEARAYNLHPHSFITLLRSKEHLMKELNYYMPRIAEKLKQNPSFDKQVQIWQEEIVKGSIQSAVKRTEVYHKERDMKAKLSADPNDKDAKAYYDEIEKKKKIAEQYAQMMAEYPESMARVLMLYINIRINGHPVQAFCDSGAQSTIMSKKVATECGLFDSIDTRFHGTAVGVGTGKILGRIHIVQLQIDNYHFPCCVTVMDDPPPGASEMPFLLGLDMMKRHLCVMDFGKGVLKFRLEPGKYLETAFLHEKDLDESKGGTKGFDVAAANQQIMEMERKEEEKEEQEGKGDKGKDADGDAKMS